jgi:hypothetical protein
MSVLPHNCHLTYQLQYRKCGKPGCHPCSNRGHGPYWYAYWRDEGGRVRSKHIPRTTLSTTVNEDRHFPSHARGLLGARSTLTTFPLPEQVLLLKLTTWVSELPRISLHTIFLSPHNLVLIPLLEGTTKALFFLHFVDHSASVQCVPAAFQTVAPQSLRQLETRYGSIRTIPRLFEEVDQTLLDQFAAAYQEAALARSGEKY